MQKFSKLKVKRSNLRMAMSGCKIAFVAVGLVTCLLNILYLSGSIYMLEVYDRVLPSRSGATLFSLTVIVLVVYAFMGVLDVIRQRLLLRIGMILDRSLRKRIFDIVTSLPLSRPISGDPAAPLHDLDRVRNFVGGPSLATLFDLPWIPFYLLICFLFHPLIGWVATIGAVILVALTLFSEIKGRRYTEPSYEDQNARFELVQMGIRNAETMKAMGMQPSLRLSFEAITLRYMESFRRMGDMTGGLSIASKMTRLALQSCVLAAGAYLVINDQTTAGVIIASSIIASRALAPVESAIGNWRAFLAARAGWERLDGLLEGARQETERMRLPPPTRTLQLGNVSGGPPGSRRMSVMDISFELEAGAGLGIIGPSASGKSTLLRIIVGAWAPARGHVRLDGASIDQWRPEDIGPHVGYLPQQVELFRGTIAQNIARFETEPDAEAVLKAAKAADVHQMILDMPDGYNTDVGQAGSHLSAGQRQRIALARALYRDPFLVVLDEPNSNLDAAGESALIAAMRSVRARGGIVVLVAHHGGVFAAVDQILGLSQGRMLGIGSKEQVFRTLPNKARASSQSKAQVAIASRQAGGGEEPPRLESAVEQGDRDERA